MPSDRVTSQLAGTVLRGLWRLGLPCIRAHAVEVLATPAELHGAMVAGATRAERRLALASLYIGCAQLTGPSGRLSAALRAADAGWFDAPATRPSPRTSTSYPLRSPALQVG